MVTTKKRQPQEVYTHHFEKGLYVCAQCSQPLFRSEDKFDAGTRWPGFRKAIRNAVATQPDSSAGVKRTELLCAKCHQHLGHLFDDGVLCGDTHPDAGLRYCVLSAGLQFRPKH